MFTIAWPAVFLLLPLIWLVKLYFPGIKKQEMMLRVPSFAHVANLNQQSAISLISTFRLRQFYVLSAWCLFLLACANPQWLGEPLTLKQDARNIMLAVDLSPSMEIPDFQHNNDPVNRLQIVKGVAANFIDKRYGDKLGLILFGSRAYLQTPLTFDRKTIRTMLDDATIGLAGERTAIGEAIGLAVKKFSHENIKSRILILLTDGGNNSGVIDPVEAAELAKNNQIKIYTVGIGATQMTIESLFGKQVVNPSADLDEDLLKKIATLTQGQYFRAQDKKTLESILEVINQLEPVSSENKSARPISSLFYWPLIGALLFFTLLFFPHPKEVRS